MIGRIIGALIRLSTAMRFFHPPYDLVAKSPVPLAAESKAVWFFS